MHKNFKLNCAKQNQESNIALLFVLILFFIIKSTTSTKTVWSAYTFRGWNYVTTIVYLTLGKILFHTDMTSLCCHNTSCGITFINFTWLLEKAPTENILKITTLLKVRNIRSLKHKFDEFVSMSFYFFGINSTNYSAYAHIYWKFHIIEGLKTNLLVSNNILAIERVIIDPINKSIIISSYQVILSIATRQKSHLMQKKGLN